MPLKPISVTTLNNYISRSLSMDPLLAKVRVQGEVSGVSYDRQRGHIYFDLKDRESLVHCIIFYSVAQHLDFEICNGDALIVTAAINVYTPRGTYSLKVSEVEKEGMGPLQLRFEELKQRLQKEGLFDPAHKKPIPFFPETVGLITSGGGAAVKDMLKNITPRNDYVDVLVFPVRVQGPDAPQEIAEAIRDANRYYPQIDVLIVGRGGGSSEDLAAFNEECVARAIYDSTIPVISAVGHEIDYMISDMVADARAETPTKAGLLAVPDTDELQAHLQDLMRQMTATLHNQVNYGSLRAESLVRQMGDLAKKKVSDGYQKIEFEKRALELSDPRRIMERGFAVVKNTDGNVISDRSALAPGQTIYMEFRDGTAEAEVRKTGDTNGSE